MKIKTRGYLDKNGNQIKNCDLIRNNTGQITTVILCGDCNLADYCVVLPGKDGKGICYSLDNLDLYEWEIV